MSITAKSTSPSAEQPARPRVTGAQDRPWHMRAWSGITVSGWLRVLSRHGFRISPSRLPMATLLTGMSVFNSSLASLQRILLGKKIAATELAEEPIFVVGHWRSGTTLLHELLVLDSEFTYPNTYACFSPNHFLSSEGWLKRLIGIFLPRQRPMDNMAIGWDLPQEDEWALCNLGLPSPYLKIMFPNMSVQDDKYYTLQELSPAERQHWQQQLHWFLKCLTIREAKRIVLKTPVHTFRIATLLEQFPNARFIHITRDPYVVIPSTIHTWRRMYRYHGLQVPKFEHLEQEVLETFSKMFRSFDADKQLLAPEQFYQLSYEDLICEPIGQLERIYQHFQLPISTATRTSWQKYADRASNYQTNEYVLTEKQRLDISRYCGDYLNSYGYRLDGAR